ncbi:MAG TPA: hypothetical protein VJM10_02955 [Candidatus Methylomirabilis sp.]|nr:hypothetical protein [Candidatus Methylomirabilis sp.]
MSEVVCAILTVVNLGILGLSVKLYTEILKERSQQRRHEDKTP